MDEIATLHKVGYIYIYIYIYDCHTTNTCLQHAQNNVKLINHSAKNLKRKLKT